MDDTKLIYILLRDLPIANKGEKVYYDKEIDMYVFDNPQLRAHNAFPKHSVENNPNWFYKNTHNTVFKVTDLNPNNVYNQYCGAYGFTTSIKLSEDKFEILAKEIEILLNKDVINV